jgi:hypothetical protein
VQSEVACSGVRVVDVGCEGVGILRQEGEVVGKGDKIEWFWCWGEHRFESQGCIMVGLQE